MGELSSKVVGAVIVLGLLIFTLVLTIGPKFEAKSTGAGTTVGQNFFDTSGKLDTTNVKAEH